MPHFTRRRKSQTVVVWDFASYDRHGAAIVSAPREIKARWEGVTEFSGVEVDGVLYTKEYLAPETRVWLGTMEDYYGTGSAGDDTNIMFVSQCAESKGLKSRNVSYTVTVKYDKDQPQVA
jgi:hypothetical protein